MCRPVSSPTYEKKKPKPKELHGNGTWRTNRTYPDGNQLPENGRPTPSSEHPRRVR